MIKLNQKQLRALIESVANNIAEDEDSFRRKTIPAPKPTPDYTNSDVNSSVKSYDKHAAQKAEDALDALSKFFKQKQDLSKAISIVRAQLKNIKNA